MRDRLYITMGVIILVSIIASFFIFKVTASENLVYVDGCTPYNVEIGKGEDLKNVEITWESKEKCSSYILYGSQMKVLDMVGVDLTNEVESRKHTVTLNGLLSSKKYYFSIISNGLSYGKDGLPLQFSIDSL